MSNYSLNERLDRISEQLGSLEETVRENRASVVELERIAVEIAEAQKALKRNARGAKHRNVAIAALVVVVSVIAFAGWRDNNNKSEKIATLVHEIDAQAQAAKAASADARVTACVAFNRDAIDRLNNLLITVRDTNPSEQTRAFIDTLIGPERNCTPEGIADYYATPQGPNAYLPIATTQPGG